MTENASGNSAKKAAPTTFAIEITEYLQRIVPIEAETEQEAVTIASKKYLRGEIILDSSDFVDWRVQPIEQ